MKPTIPALTEEFSRLIGPEAFAKAETAIAAAKIAAAAAAKAAAEKAAATAAAAKAAAEKAAAEKTANASIAHVGGVTSPRVSTANAPAIPRGEVTPPTTQSLGPRPPSAAPNSAVGSVSADLKGGLTPAVPNAAEGGRAPSGVPAGLAAAPGGRGPGSPSPAAGQRVAPAVPPRPAVSAVAPRAVTSVPAAAPMPTLPVQATVQAAKGYDFDAAVAPHQVVEAAQILDRHGFAIDTITGVDWIAQAEMEVVYDYFHPTDALRVVVRTRVPRATPEVPTISAVFPGANWHERETHDFFGIRFVGHPNLKPFLLPEDADFSPLRKDYQP